MVIAGCIGVGKPNTGCGGIACVTLPRLAAGGPGLGTAGVLGVVTTRIDGCRDSVAATSQ